jgi:hypothetical protein
MAVNVFLQGTSSSINGISVHEVNVKWAKGLAKNRSICVIMCNPLSQKVSIIKKFIFFGRLECVGHPRLRLFMILWFWYTYGFELREQWLVPRELFNSFSLYFDTFLLKSQHNIAVQLSNLHSVLNLIYSAVIQYNLIVLIDHYIKYTVTCIFIK